MITNTSFLRNSTILTLRIIPDRTLHKAHFQMMYDVCMCTVGALNSSDNALFPVWPLDYIEMTLALANKRLFVAARENIF